MMSLGLRMKPDKVKDQFVSQGQERLPEPDRVLMEKPEFMQTLIDSLQEQFRSGIAGVHHEATLYARPWRFRLQDINAEVHLWHGDLDRSVPVSVGRYVADAIPNCHARFIENEGHMSRVASFKNVTERVFVAS